MTTKSRFVLVGVASIVLTGLALDPSRAAASFDDDSYLYYVGLDAPTARVHPGGVLFSPSMVLGAASPYFDTSLGFGAASANLLGGTRDAFDLIPSAGYHVGWTQGHRGVFQLFVAGRLPIQWRSGANLPNKRGVAVAAEAGVRWWGCGHEGGHLSLTHLCFGLGLSARLRQNLTDFQFGSAVLPRGTAVLSFPFSLSIAVTPHAL